MQSITDIISKNEDIIETLEERMNQLPQDIIDELIMAYNDINSKLEEAADEWGDEPNEGDDSAEDEDNW